MPSLSLIALYFIWICGHKAKILTVIWSRPRKRGSDSFAQDLIQLKVSRGVRTFCCVISIKKDSLVLRPLIWLFCPLVWRLVRKPDKWLRDWGLSLMNPVLSEGLVLNQ